MFHVELRQFPHVARAFNLSREQLDASFVAPWVAGAMIEHDERRWAPERVRLKILEGPALAPEDLGMGRGWASAAKMCQEVTDTLLDGARRGVGARREVQALQGVIAQRAGAGLSFPDVVALAAMAQPGWRASQHLGLAEQAVWEMLHRGSLSLTVQGAPVDPDAWEPIVLSWATWAGADPSVRLRQLAR